MFWKLKTSCKPVFLHVFKLYFVYLNCLNTQRHFISFLLSIVRINEPYDLRYPSKVYSEVAPVLLRFIELEANYASSDEEDIVAAETVVDSEEYLAKSLVCADKDSSGASVQGDVCKAEHHCLVCSKCVQRPKGRSWPFKKSIKCNHGAPNFRENNNSCHRV